MAVWWFAAVLLPTLLFVFFSLSPPHCIHALLMGLCLARRTNASTVPSDTRTDGSQRIDSYLSLEAHAGCTIVGERTRTLRERQAVGGVRTLQPHDKDWIEGFAERMQTAFKPRFQSERLKNEPGNWLGKNVATVKVFFCCSAETLNS